MIRMPIKAPNSLPLLAWSQTWRLAFTLSEQILPVLNGLYGALGAAYNLFLTVTGTLPIPESEIWLLISEMPSKALEEPTPAM
ncbi:hypothetical protein RO575_07115 [Methylomonas sp. MO1]|uniref:hypothetical protein n=1 Tax=Methylomonas sp. MO1 TaxID=3073619 RepID=UPI0028A30152|nr:hypothetical protein [Methylomonas sp. MO1]MDT4289322.1 hypothetical protein [Methylomonas sp. MO1]